MKNFKSTGSISQDALRMGFQTTCSKGLAKLLKVDDITVEECAKFKNQHEEKVQKIVNTFCTKQAKLEQREFHDDYTSISDMFYQYSLIKGLLYLPKYLKYKKLKKTQKLREYEVQIEEISKPELSLNEGIWNTRINYKVVEHAWEGVKDGKFNVKKEIEYYKDHYFVSTKAKVCNLKYIPYDEYHEKYIPDEAAQAAFDATQIGLKNLRVVKPIIENADLDPIIVGFVEDQMFIVAWFGYDKNNHMACNI